MTSIKDNSETINRTSTFFCIFCVCCPFTLSKYCLLKYPNKLFTFHTSLLTSRHLKMAVSGIQKNHTKYFAAGRHQNHGYERPTQSMKSSFIDVYDIE